MSENKDTKNGWGVLIVAVSTVIFLWGLNWVLFWLIPKSDERGQFGDMFGSVNALFSGLAFAFLIYTIWLQREELKLQREELKLQREALELQTEELKRQANELKETSQTQKESLELQKLNRAELIEEKERSVRANFIQYGDIDVRLESQQCELSLKLINTGAFAANVQLNCDPSLERLVVDDTPQSLHSTIAQIKQNQVLRLVWVFETLNVDEIREKIEIQIRYININGKDESQSLKIRNNFEATKLAERFKII